MSIIPSIVDTRSNRQSAQAYLLFRVSKGTKWAGVTDLAPDSCDFTTARERIKTQYPNYVKMLAQSAMHNRQCLVSIPEVVQHTLDKMQQTLEKSGT